MVIPVPVLVPPPEGGVGFSVSVPLPEGSGQISWCGVRPKVEPAPGSLLTGG